MLQKMLMYTNLKLKKILIAEMTYSPHRGNVFETGSTLPNRLETSLSAATS